jgi:hypothetical protein
MHKALGLVPTLQKKEKRKRKEGGQGEEKQNCRLKSSSLKICEKI